MNYTGNSSVLNSIKNASINEYFGLSYRINIENGGVQRYIRIKNDPTPKSGEK